MKENLLKYITDTKDNMTEAIKAQNETLKDVEPFGKEYKEIHLAIGFCESNIELLTEVEQIVNGAEYDNQEGIVIKDER